jgi:uncharacterized protein YhaN
MQRADAFALSAAGDDRRSLCALCAWAERFEAREGRPPVVWLRALCADLSLSPAELLAQLPCYLTRCDRLLLLASPHTPHDLHAVIAIHVWRTLGGPADTIEVALVAAAEREQTVAAFDAFHVMHADAQEPAAEATAAERAAVAQRLRLCAQLATVRALNAEVRDLLPAVHAAAAAIGAAASSSATTPVLAKASLLSPALGSRGVRAVGLGGPWTRAWCCSETAGGATRLL